jgi:hypothetical protein
MRLLRFRPYQIFCIALAQLAVQFAATSQSTSDSRPAISVVRASSSIVIDGKLDESSWRSAAGSVLFTQREPNEGEPVSEKTSVVLLLDDRALYIGIRCEDSDVSQLVANELRRDAVLTDNDCVELYLDSYHDHRTAFFFATNPLGAQRDGIVLADVNEEDQSWDWNGVWENACTIDSAGWTAEFAIPFQTLRFHSGDNTTWGLNVGRLIPRKREEAYWTPIRREYGWAGKFRVSVYGHLTGLGILKQHGDLELKPFVLAGSERDYEEVSSPEFRKGFGLDAKFHVTPNITADLSLNTDFAQVEADQEQTNLTRFELLFPEKRDFFLEGASIFRFGERSYTPLMPASVFFFSRRIGLSEDNTVIPLIGGVKVTGKTSGLGVGFMNMTADRSTYLNDDDEEITVPRTNYGVLRLRQDVMENSYVGMIALNKQGIGVAAYNRGVGLDANFYVSPNTQVGGFLAKSVSPDMKGKDLAAYLDFTYSDDFFSVFLNQNSIQDNFNPEMGYFQRTGIRRSEVSFGLSPRPGVLNLRQVTWFNDFHYIANQQGRLDARYLYTGLWSQFTNGAYLLALMSWNAENLTESFDLSDGVGVAAGSYRYASAFAEFSSDKSRGISGGFVGRLGTFYDGDIVGYGGTLNLKLGSHLTLNLQGERNIINVKAGNVTTNLVSSRFTYAFSPRLYVKAFVQWNSQNKELLANVLLSLIHTPGSDLFIVYNDQLSTTGRGLSSIYRTILLKCTYLFSL